MLDARLREPDPSPSTQGSVAVIRWSWPSFAVLDVELQLVVGRRVGDDPGQVAALLGQVAVDRSDHVAGLEAGLFRRRSG